jgi:hypothetical protein
MLAHGEQAYPLVAAGLFWTAGQDRREGEPQVLHWKFFDRASNRGCHALGIHVSASDRGS